MPRVLPILAVSLALLSCGYRLLAAPPGYESGIELRMLENRSDEPGFERMLQDALQEEFARRGEIEPRYRAGGSPPALVLAGVVREVNVSHTGLSSVGLALEDQVEVVLDISIARGDGDVVWRREDWSRVERFTSSSDPQVYLTNKTQALRRITSEMAGRVHDELLQSL